MGKSEIDDIRLEHFDGCWENSAGARKVMVVGRSMYITGRMVDAHGLTNEVQNVARLGVERTRLSFDSDLGPFTSCLWKMKLRQSVSDALRQTPDVARTNAPGTPVQLSTPDASTLDSVCFAPSAVSPAAFAVGQGGDSDQAQVRSDCGAT